MKSVTGDNFELCDNLENGQKGMNTEMCLSEV